MRSTNYFEIAPGKVFSPSQSTAPSYNGSSKETDSYTEIAVGHKNTTKSKDKPLIVFSYWKIMGIAEPVRMLLHYLDLPFAETNPKNYSRWRSSQEKLQEDGLDFPNLPYIYFNDFKLSEKHAIMWYIAKKVGPKHLIGKTMKEQAFLRQLINVLRDLCYFFMLASLQKDYKKALRNFDRPGSKTDLLMKRLSNFLGQREFLMDYFTIADINMSYVVLKYYSIYRSAGLADPYRRYPNLKEHHHRIFELEGIREYVEEDMFNRPLLPPKPFPWVKFYKVGF